MPSIAKTIGLIFVVANPVCLTAQTPTPDDYPLSAGERTGIGGGQMGENAAQVPQPHSYSQGYSQGEGIRWDPLPQGEGTGRRPLQASSDVLPAAFRSPLPSDGDPSPYGDPSSSADAATAAVPLSPPGRHSPLPLAPPGRSNRTERGDRTSGLPSLVTVASSLAVVLGIFFLVAWGMRRAAPPGSAALPSEVFELLGRAPMAGRQQAYLLRCGNKLVLISVTAAGAETLTEITDPIEVDRLAGLCRQAHPNSATAAFRQVFGQFAPRRPKPGLLGKGDRNDGPLAGTGAPAPHDGLEDLDV